MPTVDLIPPQWRQHHITHTHAHRTYRPALVDKGLLVNTYRTSDLCRPRARARPQRDDRRAFPLTRSGAGVDLPGFGRGRSDMSDREDDGPAARPALGARARRSADREEDRHRPWRNPIFHQMMPPLNAAV
jgi:hypothetical protein